MKVKKLLVAALLMVAASSYGQNIIGQDYSVSPNVITTAVPFVSISPDARGGSMGDCGVATTPDVYSMHYNPAKYVYLEDKFAGGLGYSPWLRNLVPDMNLAYLALAYKINERSSVAGTLRYFSCGEIEFRDHNNISQGKYSPNDVAVYYKRPVEWFSSMDADFAWGAAITNIGSKISYNGQSERRDFIPTTLRLGAGLKLDLDEYNSLAFNVDFSKLMVPTPPVIERDDQGNPMYNDDGTYKILYGYDNNVSVVQGMIQSFYDAPGYGYNSKHELVNYGKFYEELCEINIGGGIEYWYNNTFAVRAGYFNETALKGNRKFVTLGAALKYNVFGLDVSYLIPVNTVAGSNPLENTLRFNLTYSMGGKKS